MSNMLTFGALMRAGIWELVGKVGCFWTEVCVCLHVQLRSRMHGAIPLFSQYTFMACCSVKAQGQLYPYLYLYFWGQSHQFGMTCLTVLVRTPQMLQLSLSCLYGMEIYLYFLKIFNFMHIGKGQGRHVSVLN